MKNAGYFHNVLLLLKFSIIHVQSLLLNKAIEVTFSHSLDVAANYPLPHEHRPQCFGCIC